MNKQDIIKYYNEFLKKNNVKAEDVILGSGGACVMHGIRIETADMDVAVTKVLFDKLMKTNKYNTHTFTGWFNSLQTSLEYSDHIDLHVGITDNGDSNSVVYIDGVCCYSLETLLNHKLKMNRPKDQSDIELIKKMLHQKQSKPHWTKW